MHHLVLSDLENELVRGNIDSASMSHCNCLVRVSLKLVTLEASSIIARVFASVPILALFPSLVLTELFKLRLTRI